MMRIDLICKTCLQPEAPEGGNVVNMNGGGSVLELSIRAVQNNIEATYPQLKWHEMSQHPAH
jgi:hypothetical protein